MSFKSVLQHIGEDILKVFTIGEKAATIAEPFVDLAFPQLAGLFNSTLSAVSNAQALGIAAAASGNTDTQKLANVITAITPQVNTTLISLGVPAADINSTIVKNYVKAFVALLNTLPAPAATTAPATSGALAGVATVQPTTDSQAVKV